MTRPPLRDHLLPYRIWEVLCKSHTGHMTRYNARSGQEPKGWSPYGSLEEARGALMTDFHWNNVRFREVGAFSIGKHVPGNGYQSTRGHRRIADDARKKELRCQGNNGIFSVPIGV